MDSVLSGADKIINGDRQDSYGNPEDSFQIIANYWMAYLKNTISLNDTTILTPLDVAHMMTLFKIARMQGQKPHKDNYVDACGYLAIAGDRLLDA